jgi:hypothetical protein
MVVWNNGVVAGEPLGPTRLSYIYMVFPPSLTYYHLYPDTHPYAIYCIGTPHIILHLHQHSAAVYAHIIAEGIYFMEIRQNK